MPINTKQLTKSNQTLDGKEDRMINFVGESQIFDSSKFLNNKNFMMESSRTDDDPNQ